MSGFPEMANSMQCSWEYTGHYQRWVPMWIRLHAGYVECFETQNVVTKREVLHCDVAEARNRPNCICLTPHSPYLSGPLSLQTSGALEFMSWMKAIQDSISFETQLQLSLPLDDVENNNFLIDPRQLAGFETNKKCVYVRNSQVVSIHTTGAYISETTQLQIDIMKHISHPNIVEFIDAFLSKDIFYIIWEFMSGGTLLDFLYSNRDDEGLTETPFSEHQIAFIAREVLHALEYLHSINVIHCSVTVDCVMLQDNGQVKLGLQSVESIIDQLILGMFGEAASMKLKKNSAPRRTSEDNLLYWLSPEQIRTTEVTTKADLWSLGVMCRELAEGEPPYIGQSPIKVLFLITSRGLPPLKDASLWSSEFQDFLALLSLDDPTVRPDAVTILKHAFLLRASNAASLVPLIQNKLNHPTGH
ncbi:serine/threonine kinase [Pelomyxa schiedti]|nr:serine/threonine kinase [Pelomyxa schiedti]